MRTRDFDYHLPAERIAQRAVPRGQSRLLVLPATSSPRHGRISDLTELLRPNDLLVVNDTRVLPARLFATRPDTGGKIEIFLVEPCDEKEWRCLVKPGRRARPGQRFQLDPELEAEVLSRDNEGSFRLRFSQPIEPHLERLGHIPLPPYIHRGDDAEDRERYQTLFAVHPGAVAAPTAGLHFSSELLAALETRGIRRAAVTLHVGIGTFRPVSVETIVEHRMESERFEVPEATAHAIAETRASGGRVVAVGTTVVRTLETAASLHGLPLPAASGRSELFITPGFEFRVVDLLLTNFHLPQSTLLMLVSAFAGRERVLAAYEEAIREDYRFYSYGDAMLLERARGTRISELP